MQLRGALVRSHRSEVFPLMFVTMPGTLAFHVGKTARLRGGLSLVIESTARHGARRARWAPTMSAHAPKLMPHALHGEDELISASFHESHLSRSVDINHAPCCQVAISDRVNLCRDTSEVEAGPGTMRGTLRVMDNGASQAGISRVVEAQGMVSAQAACTTEKALQLLNERAQATGLRLEEVAVAVVNRRTQFRPAAVRAPI